MDERKRELKIQEIIKEFSNLSKKAQLAIESKQPISAWKLELEAGAILIKAFRLGCFENEGQLRRIIASFDSKVESEINYQMIFQTVCEKYLTKHRSGFDFEMKRHQFGLEKALVFSINWFADFLTEYVRRIYGLPSAQT